MEIPSTLTKKTGYLKIDNTSFISTIFNVGSANGMKHLKCFFEAFDGTKYAAWKCLYSAN